jgi:exosome complex component RRP46
MQDAGGLLATCVNAACLALLDACVSLRHLVAAVTCALPADGDGRVLVDPDQKQLAKSRAHCVFVFESREGGLVASTSQGRLSPEQLQECLAAGRRSAAKIFDFYRLVVGRKFAKDIT